MPTSAAPPLALSEHLRRSRWTWIVLFWTLFGAVRFVVAYIVHLVGDQPFDLDRRLWGVVAWYTWVPTTGLVLWAARRYPIERQRIWLAVPVHLVGIVAASLFTSFLWKGLQALAAVVQGQPYDLAVVLREALARYLPMDATIYMTMLAAVHAFDYYRRYKGRLVREAELQRALAESQLRALRMQLHPHFFFNALHTIAMLVRQGRNDEAVDAIAEMGGLFRYVLDHSATQEVTLARELDFFESYLGVERIRFGDRLRSCAVIEPEVRGAAVPFMLLQPLVENVLKHGMGPPGRCVLVEVRAWREGAHVRVLVRDDGQGLPPGWDLERSSGVGLANTRARLERLYGAEHAFSVRRRAAGGTEVDLVLPYRLLEASPEEAAFALAS